MAEHVPPRVAGYFALINRAPDRRDSLICLQYSDAIFDQVRHLEITDGPVKWATPTHLAFQVMPSTDGQSHDEITARLIRLATLIDDLNPRFKG